MRAQAAFAWFVSSELLAKTKQNPRRTGQTKGLDDDAQKNGRNTNSLI